MWNEERNTNTGYTPKIVQRNPHPWLITFIGQRSMQECINSILIKADTLLKIDKHDIPKPVYNSQFDVMLQIDDLKENDRDIIARFYKYIFNPIQEIHSKMLPGTKVAIVFDKRDFSKGTVFKMLAKNMPGLFIPICSTIDFSWSRKGCINKTCRERTENCDCSHNCLYKLTCMLLERNELPEELFVIKN